jgi:hypothetical protein
LQSEESIDDQFRLLRQYVERNGGDWSLVQCFHDAAESGASTDRPGIQDINHLDDLLKKDPVRAREQLRHFIHSGRIEMHTRGEDGWVARFRLYPALILEKPTKGIGPGAKSEAAYFASCAGTLGDEYTRLIEPVPVVLNLPLPENRRHRPDLWRKQSSATTEDADQSPSSRGARAAR